MCRSFAEHRHTSSADLAFFSRFSAGGVGPLQSSHKPYAPKVSCGSARPLEDLDETRTAQRRSKTRKNTRAPEKKTRSETRTGLF